MSELLKFMRDKIYEQERLFQIINCNLKAGEIIKNEDSYNMLKDVISDLWCCIKQINLLIFLSS